VYNISIKQILFPKLLLANAGIRNGRNERLPKFLNLPDSCPTTRSGQARVRQAGLRKSYHFKTLFKTLVPKLVLEKLGTRNQNVINFNLV
ncbi:MAG: hypothetical protein ACHQJ4_01360, partial [Ignavibacteria bacterium]